VGIVTRTNLQIRASEAEKELAKTLAEDYGTNVSDLIRMALVYINENRPKLTLTIELEGSLSGYKTSSRESPFSIRVNILCQVAV